MRTESSLEAQGDLGTGRHRKLIGTWESWLNSQSVGVVSLFGVVLIGVIGVVDYVTGPYVSCSLFYMMPVMLVAHYGGLRAGVLAAVSAMGAWLAADLLALGRHGLGMIPYWNAVMRLGVFLVTAGLVARMRALNASLERRVRERTEELESEMHKRRQLEKRILEITDGEQARIGQDLHDGLCQILVGTAFAANQLRESLATGSRADATVAEEIACGLDNAITEARQVARGLYPVRLEADGLVVALQELAANTSSRSGLLCSAAVPERVSLPNDATAIHLYRIAQEAVNNAVKHAEARHVWIVIDGEGKGVRLKIEDDGVGIHAHAHNPEGMGLNIMAYRARMIGGELKVVDRPDGGTEISCTTESRGVL